MKRSSLWVAVCVLLVGTVAGAQTVVSTHAVLGEFTQKVGGEDINVVTLIPSGFNRSRTFGEENRFDSWGTGLEIAVGGHVFQIVVTNSVGLTTDQYLRGGDLDITDGELRLGFNIFRILNF